MAHASKTVDEKLEDAVPRVSMDYFFMSKNDEKANEYPMLVAVDDAWKTKQQFRLIKCFWEIMVRFFENV